MEFVSAVIHSVKDLDLAKAVLIRCFDFTLVNTTDDRLELTNGALSIVLVKNREGDDGPLSLALSTNDMDTSVQALLQESFTAETTPQWVSQTRQEIRMSGPAGIQAVLYRDYDEDELDILPDLPKSLEWDSDADRITRQLLKSVPLAFRDSARNKVTQIAEADAIVEGETTVSQDLACRAMVKTAPNFQHEVLKEGMRACGLEPEDFFHV